MKATHLTQQENTSSADFLITKVYQEYLPLIINFISNRIKDRDEASDLAQDAFVRLIEYKQMLRPDTVKSFVFTIVRNLIIDHVRRQYVKNTVTANMYEMIRDFQESSESQLIADDILRLENGMLMTMPKQRKAIYMLDRFENKSADEIAEQLNIKKRTVESHLFVSRRIVRNYIRQCI